MRTDQRLSRSHYPQIIENATNLISLEMEPADVDSILAAIAAVHRKMAPLLTDLTSADRKSLSKLPSAKTPLIPELLCPNETADIAINKAAQLP